MKISITIPCYEYKGLGKECLEYSFNKISEQTYKDFDVIISDHSVDHEIESLCKKWEKKFEIRYFRNEEKRGSASANINNVIKNADGKWIKFLCQDDYLLRSSSLETIANATEVGEFSWLATAYLHTADRKNYFNYHFPYLNPQIYVVNTIGTPSCVAFKNTDSLPLFDEELTYCYDCEYYYRLLKEYGKPYLSNDETIVNYLWENSTSNSTTQETIIKENDYILRKHGIV